MIEHYFAGLIGIFTIFSKVFGNDFILDSCYGKNHTCLELLCQTYSEYDGESNDAVIKYQYLQYAYTQKGKSFSSRHQIDLQRFAEMLLDSFHLSNLAIIISSGPGASSLSDLKNLFQILKKMEKVQVVTDQQLNNETLAESHAYLPLEVQSIGLLLKFIESRASSFWFFSEKYAALIEKLKIPKIFMFTKLNNYSEMKIFKAYRVEDHPIEYGLWGLWNTKDVLNAPSRHFEQRIYLKNATIRVTAMTVLSVISYIFFAGRSPFQIFTSLYRVLLSSMCLMIIS